jgi:hypothetical protein
MYYYQSPSGNYFNSIWYKNTYNLHYIDDNKLMEHYINIGYKENYNPSLYFNTQWYRQQYNLDNNICPLIHFCDNINNSTIIKPNDKCEYYIFNGPWNSGWVNIKNDFIPLQNEKKRINLLLPGLSLSAGPQTIYLFANILANNNYNVRIISTYAPYDINQIDDIKNRLNINVNIEFISLYTEHIPISFDDIFITSAWWTVYPLKFILGYLNKKIFLWFIQENELLLHSGNETYAQAIECYNMDYYSFINTSILFEDLKKIGFFKFKNNDYINNKCICFEPAFNRTLFKYVNKDPNRKIKIIFYSRDANVAERNLVRLLHNLLLNAYKNNIIDNNFIIYGFGQKKNIVNICDNFYYEDLGFLNLDEYADLIVNSDILISFQLAPHPSYPPLEMAHCNGVCLHTEFSNKTNETISSYSDKIILSEPSINGLLDGLKKCINIVKNNNINNEYPKLLNQDWNIALLECLNLTKEIFDN